ncbi:hypothetical protein GCM10011507_13600 [Edaphobacter acidisoli]|uniref:Uncharacterized protein n=2 Tax=Edaphobacter acidisoli TaxID=2040573 RepID=A0A916RPB9_9BACT|nr:hypothetical protein [Edaphobacter acidisoli]GGA63233.1 hypothetical protein GCM10011507_13600 [Edaphobacter acidisoli]
MLRFDMGAFYRAVDEHRQRRGLNWVELAAEVNRPFEGNTSIPIHAATIRDMPKKRSVTSAVVLQVLRWMEAAPEDFLDGADREPMEGERLPEAGPREILRFDTGALHAALDRRRRERAMTWRQVAEELPGFTATMLTNLAGGPLIGFPRVMTLTQWLGLPAAKFVRACLH